MGDWTTVIPSASYNYTPCNQNTIEVSEVCAISYIEKLVI